MKKFYILLLCLMTSSMLFANDVFITKTIVPVANFDTLQNDETKEKLRTRYHAGKLTITGLYAKSNISIYNLLGKKVVDLKNISIKGTFNKHIDLPKSNIYIVKISTTDFSKTFKIVSK